MIMGLDGGLNDWIKTELSLVTCFSAGALRNTADWTSEVVPSSTSRFETWMPSPKLFRWSFSALSLGVLDESVAEVATLARFAWGISSGTTSEGAIQVELITECPVLVRKETWHMILIALIV